MHKYLCFILFALLSLSVTAQNDTVVFSASGGFYEEVFSLELNNANPQHHIRYTTTGNRPTAQSRLYEEPLILDERQYSHSDIYTIQISPDELVFIPDSIQHCIIIRAAVFDENDSCVSQVVTNSYFIKALGCDTHGLPAVSLCADSLDLFDYERGIMVPGMFFNINDPQHTGNYYQKGLEWERQVNVEYCDYGSNCGVNQPCGLRAHGNRARRYPQKGLKIYAREEYGKKRFKYKFFETTPINDFKHLVIKPFSSLYPYSGVQDYICTQMALSIGLEAGHSRPVVLFINGEYWGIYFLQEKMDARYLEDHYGIPVEKLYVVGNWSGYSENVGEIDENGNLIEFVDMMAWLETADLSQEEDYRHIDELIDIDNFIDYMILETFIANNDWPANNMRCWKTEHGKWRWLFFDGDAALNNYSLNPYAQPVDLDVFGNATYSGNYTWPSSSQATLLFRRLLDNASFRMAFHNRIHELCDDALSYENSSPLLARVKNMMRPEIENQSFRFDNPPYYDYWNWSCSLADDFLRSRVETYIAEWEAFTIGLPEDASFFGCYPNPSSDELHIALDGNVKADEIAIYDLMGRKVFAQPFKSSGVSDVITINPSLLPGVYVMRIGSHAQKIVRM